MNSLNITYNSYVLTRISMTKYINVNNKTSFIYVSSWNYHQICNAVKLDDVTANEIIKTRRF